MKSNQTCGKRQNVVSGDRGCDLRDKKQVEVIGFNIKGLLYIWDHAEYTIVKARKNSQGQIEVIHTFDLSDDASSLLNLFVHENPNIVDKKRTKRGIYSKDMIEKVINGELASAVIDLRTPFGCTHKQPRIIRTHYKIGKEFLIASENIFPFDPAVLSPLKIQTGENLHQHSPEVQQEPVKNDLVHIKLIENDMFFIFEFINYSYQNVKILGPLVKPGIPDAQAEWHTIDYGEKSRKVMTKGQAHKQITDIWFEYPDGSVIPVDTKNHLKPKERPYKEGPEDAKCEITNEDLYYLLVSLKRGAQLFTYQEGSLSIDGTPLREDDPRHMSSGAIDSCLKILLNSLNLEFASIHAFIDILNDRLGRIHQLSRNQIFELARKYGVFPNAHTPQDECHKWRFLFEKELWAHDQSYDVKEKLADSKNTVPTKKRYLELAPVTIDWPKRILTHPKWRYANCPIPGIQPLPLDDVWVMIQLFNPFEEGTPFKSETLQMTNFEETSWRSEPATVVLDRLKSSAVLVGEPGIGKTTLLKWLARKMIKDPGGRYLLPLFVSLREYAISNRSAQLSLLEFALKQMGVPTPEHIHNWSNTLSHLSGLEKKTVIFFLDGWDEVPDEDKESLKQEIERISAAFAMIITSRPSGFPLSLPVNQFYSITELSKESVRSLSVNWFKAMNALDKTDSFLKHLETHPDLKRMSQNPFLLTLLCGIHFLTSKDNSLHSIPTTRTQVYDRLIQLIQNQHNSDKPGTAFKNQDVQALEQLAYWLFVEVEDAPRFVFSSGELQQFCQDSKCFKEVLSPSRFISRWDWQKDLFHFLHATFQEYFVAKRLIQSSDSHHQSLLESNLLTSRWREVLKFYAGHTGQSNPQFWRAVRQAVEHCDRFGTILVLVAELLAEVNVHDGGQSLIGLDIRPLLWDQILKNVLPRKVFHALKILDQTDLLMRAEITIEKGSSYHKVKIKRILGNVSNVEIENLLLNDLCFENEEKASVACHSLSKQVSVKTLAYLRNGIRENLFPQQNANWILKTMGLAKDPLAVEFLGELFHERKNLRKEILQALGQIGDNNSYNFLFEQLDCAKEIDEKKEIIQALGNFRSRQVIEKLLTELACLHTDDELAINLLESLASTEMPIPHHAKSIIRFLESSNEGVRVNATYALEHASELLVHNALVETIKTDSSIAVQLAALNAVKKHPRVSFADWCYKKALAEDQSSYFRTLCAENLFEIYKANSSQHFESKLHSFVREIITLGCMGPIKDFSMAVVSHAYILGDKMVSNLHHRVNLFSAFNLTY